MAGDEADDDAGEELERVRHDDEHGEVAEEEVEGETKDNHEASRSCLTLSHRANICMVRLCDLVD